MIAPLPQAAAVPPDARGSGDPKNGQEPADLFAQLLGAAGIAGSAQLAGDEAAPIAIAVAKSAVEQSSDKSEAAPAPLARMFNQDGFFGHALAEDVAAEAPSTPVAGTLAEGLADEATGKGPLPETLPAPGAPAGGITTAARGTVQAVRTAETLAVKPSGAGPVAVSVAVRASSTAEAEGDAPVIRRQTRLLRGVLAAQSPIHVAIGEVEQGLRVTAHVAGLDETERRQLREAISALLARHGLASARIQINAMPIRGNAR